MGGTAQESTSDRRGSYFIYEAVKMPEDDRNSNLTFKPVSAWKEYSKNL